MAAGDGVVTQFVTEVLVKQLVDGRVTQVAVEVLIQGPTFVPQIIKLKRISNVREAQ